MDDACNNNTLTLGDLVNRVITRLKDVEYPQETVAQFLNDAYFEVLGEDRYNNLLEKVYEAQTAGGENTIALPGDYQTLIHLTATDEHGTMGLDYMPSRQFFDMAPDDARKNYHYTCFGGKVVFKLPEPDKEADGDFTSNYTMRMYYLAKPKPLVKMTDKFIFPAEYGEILVLGALARAERLRDNFDYAAIYMNDFYDQITNMKQRLSPRQLDAGSRAKLPVRINARY